MEVEGVGGSKVWEGVESLGARIILDVVKMRNEDNVRQKKQSFLTSNLKSNHFTFLLLPISLIRTNTVVSPEN
jgi:hypothetical protein